MHSPPWPGAGSQRQKRKEEDKESVSGEWGDKMMVNRNDSLTSDDSLVGQWEAESKQSSPMLSPSYLSEPSKISLEHSFKVTMHKKDSQDHDTASTDDSDDQVEVATSDSSEPDLHWQLNMPKTTGIPSRIGTKAKRSTQLRPAKTPETR